MPKFARRILLSAVLATTSVSTGCELARAKLYPTAQMHEMGAAAYTEQVKSNKIIKTGKQAEMVRRVGERIAKASGQNYAWEFTLFDAPETVNAFCLPGGKIAVYSGLFKVATDEDSLAAVMGHEVAHATMEHGNERLTQNTVGKGINLIAGLALGFEEDPEKQKNNQLILGALGVGTKLGILGYSRLHETEADEKGLEYLIKAGYRPEAAPALWERMAKLSGQQRDLLSGFLSTHPHPLDRAENLRKLIPQMRAQFGAQKQLKR